MLSTKLQKNAIAIYAAVISVLLSLIALYSQDPLNYDGILYLATASTYLKSGFSAALTLYSWPFYSILIAWFSTLTHLSLLHSAHFINIVLFSILVATFITLIKELGGSRAVQISAALIILIYPQLNDYRSFIVRDFGYWSFSLVAFWQLLRFSKTLQLKNALAWNFAMLAASLFRIEGMVLVLFAPLILLVLSGLSWQQRLTTFLKAYTIPLFVLFIFIVWHHYHAQENLGRISDLYTHTRYVWIFTAAALKIKIKLVAANIVNTSSLSDAWSFIIYGLTGTLIAQIISAFGLLYLLFCGHTLLKKLVVTSTNNKLVWAFFLLVNLLIPLVFLAQQFFLSSRYLLAFCLPALLLAPFSLDYLFRNWHQEKYASSVNRWLIPAITCYLLIMLISSIFHFSYSKAYITQAGLWLKTNTQPTATVYSNNKQILFYAERTPIDFQISKQTMYDDSQPLQTIKDNAWHNFDYLALRINHDAQNDEAQIITLTKQKPIKDFHNNRGDAVLIFKLQ